jgi:hypothetical protein
MLQKRKPITCQMYAALREARVVGLARVSSGNLNPSAVDAAIRDGRLQGTQIAQQQQGRQNIDRSTIANLSCAAEADKHGRFDVLLQLLLCC